MSGEVVVAYVRRSAPNPLMLDALRAALPDVVIEPVSALGAEALAGARVAILDGIDVDQLAALPALEMVHATWAGVESVLEVVEDGIHVVRMVDPQMAATMAETVLTWVLYLHREGPAYLRQQRNREWLERPQVLAADRRVGVLGLGALGVASATTLRDQGFDVAGWSRSPKSIDGVGSFHGHDGFGALLERSDIVVNLLPHTPDTEGLLDAGAFARLPDNASIVNVGRGSTIDDEALLAALDHRLSHAVLDVFHVEPLPADHQFWDRDDVTVLPHIAANTTPATAAAVAAENIRAYLADGALPGDALVDRARGY
ncbi:MAG: 2-hydroxyacid dehydrogenase [Ilumatobacter sp.]